MIPAVMDFLPRRRRTVPPPELAGTLPWPCITSHGSTGQQAPGKMPSWPREWRLRYPLDPVVFGSEPRVREP